MCGIAGIIDSSMDRATLQETTCKMAEALLHRGPDDHGIWVDESTGLGLGHRRLSILDLTPLGRQPMVSPGGRYCVVFNGEVYNFRGLRAELEQKGSVFRGCSDTEVMLTAFDTWGIERSLRRFTGMFAIAVWDSADRTLYLIRDRLGKKPIYYGWSGHTFLFGSELKAIRTFPSCRPEINRDSAALFLRHGYVPSPFSIYKNFFKLPSGTILKVRPGRPARVEGPVSYWSIMDSGWAARSNSFHGSADDALARLDSLLQDAVRLRMTSDVPLGAFLSGGIDSSLIVALMQRQSAAPIRTFTIGFTQHGYDEADHARSVACHLGTDHVELYVTPDEAMSVIPRLPELYDEPFADSSQIPVCLLSKLARRDVGVVLSGDGGDELFGGYQRYRTALGLWPAIRWVPWQVRRAVAGIISSVSPEVADRFLPRLAPVLNRHGMPGPVGDKLKKAAMLLGAGSLDDLFRALVSHWNEPNQVVPGSNESPTRFEEFKFRGTRQDYCSFMMCLDAATYLPDDILTKLDRASMGVSLETRAPLLDHRLVEYALRLPLSLKYRDGTTKWILRQLLYRYVPRYMVERPKMGFAVPISSWLRGPLRDWAEDLLSEPGLRCGGLFSSGPIRQKWREHLSGVSNWHHLLWCVLMFQSWARRWSG
ncbi:MAG: asparagine synthase (glutamine-hydrolyzing) [Syntrophobacteraceae bacterium]